MKKTKLKIENFVGNKLENLSIIKGGELGPPESTGGGSTSNGTGGGLGSSVPFPHIPPKPTTPPLLEAPDLP